jgi:hypothetical protein
MFDIYLCFYFIIIIIKDICLVLKQILLGLNAFCKKRDKDLKPLNIFLDSHVL